MDPFARAIDSIFTHPHFGLSAIFFRAGAEPDEGISVRILLRQPDTIDTFGDTQIIADTTLVEVRTSQISSPPVAGDRFVIGARTITVMGGARRDSARLTWVCEARE